MITNIKINVRPAEWADHVIRAAAGMAYAGSVFGYEKIVAARIWLAGPRDRPLDSAAEGQPRWSGTRKDELTAALDEWENEGGGIPR